MSLEEEAASMNEQQVEALRDKLRRKLARLRERKIRKDGYALDEATGELVPPGYIRDPDYVAGTRDIGGEAAGG